MYIILSALIELYVLLITLKKRVHMQMLLCVCIHLTPCVCMPPSLNCNVTIMSYVLASYPGLLMVFM